MKARLTVLAMVLLVGGCGNEAATPEDAMAALALKKGYRIAGTPWHDGTRWVSTNRIDSCAGNVVLHSNGVPAHAKPTSFTVHSVADTEFTDNQPANMSAEDLLGREGIRAKLGCK